MGSWRYPLHPPVRLSPLRESRQRPRETVRLHPVGSVRLSRRVLAGHIESREGTHHEHAPVGAGASVFRRRRLRPPLAER